MSYQSAQSTYAPSREEAPFQVEELFFSRTDGRGVIEAGNDVFRRIAGYSWEELVGAPHKIIRHPDMPKGVFYILWERIKKGLPTGAYVKNRAKDGRYYWVYAIVSPVDGGYVSVRLKPTSKAFAETQKAYAAFLAAETNEGLTPEESAARIRGALADMGFPSYAAFSSYAVAQELASRDTLMGRPQDGRLRSLKELLPALQALNDEQKSLFESFAAIRGIPSNMRIVASRLEPAGGPISAISMNYRLMSDEVTSHLFGFHAKDDAKSVSEQLLSRIYSALFMVAASRIQREVREHAEEALADGQEDDGFAAEVEVLRDLVDVYSRQAGLALAEVANNILALTRSAKDLRQLVTGLDSIRVLCRVEAGRLGANSASLTPVIDQLDRFHVIIDETLERILDHADRVKDLVDRSMPRSMNGTLR